MVFMILIYFAEEKFLKTFSLFAFRYVNLKLSLINEMSPPFPWELTFNLFFVPTPLVGGGTIYSNGFFLFRQFWPIDMLTIEKCERYQ